MKQEILAGRCRISVIGLGYVGLPLAVAFARKAEVIGFDVNTGKIAQYRQGIDPTNEVGSAALRRSTIRFTSHAADLRQARFHIIAVPTPIDSHKNPDLSMLKQASTLLGENLETGSIVVYESTVYPGVTEEICLPALEAASGLKAGRDFAVGYSPERINPGDKLHTLEQTIKIVSAMDRTTLAIIADVYSMVIKAGVHQASSIKVAEAAKVIENCQRDINIAFVNELSIIFNRMGLNTEEVLAAAGTKWNFLDFFPGLVGGHCIGVDPYYLTYRSEELGYTPQVILAGRTINDGMGKQVAENTVKQMIQAGCQINNSNVLIMGLTFKENVPDIRNTRVKDIIDELEQYGITVYVHDPLADAAEVQATYGLKLRELDAVPAVHAVVFAVAHEPFKQLKLSSLSPLYGENGRVLIDVKWLFDARQAKEQGFSYWRL